MIFRLSLIKMTCLHMLLINYLFHSIYCHLLVFHFKKLSCLERGHNVKIIYKNILLKTQEHVYEKMKVNVMTISCYLLMAQNNIVCMRMYVCDIIPTILPFFLRVVYEH